MIDFRICKKFKCKHIEECRDEYGIYLVCELERAYHPLADDPDPWNHCPYVLEHTVNQKGL